MKLNKKFKICVGTVIAIPIDNKRFAYGQIIADTKPECYIIFDYISNEYPDINELVSKKIIMLTYTVGTFIENGDWIIIGNVEPSGNIVIPEYIVDTLDGVMVVDCRRNIIRKASESDMTLLGTHKSVSPKVLDMAVKAKHGVGEWYPYMKILEY